MNIPERVLNALMDGYEARLKAQQSTIDALVRDNENLALALALKETDLKWSVK